MYKQNLLKVTALTAAAVCMFLLAACNSDPGKGTEENTTQAIVETEDSKSVQDTEEPETEAETTTAPASEETEAETEMESEQSDPAETETEPEVTEASSEASDEVIAKINGGADEVGIYSVVVRLTDQAADKGVIEMVYYGAKGSPQEDSIVNTFRIEYYKEAEGTYEIQTFFDGEVYQNLHHKDEMKVVNTFGAELRAGSVIISYTPDGGETQEIFREDAEYFYAP